MNLVLVKRISLGEASKGMIFIHPAKLDSFPESEFPISTGKGEESVKIISLSCNCSVSPEEHKHYYLPVKGVKMSKGSVVQIKESNGNYSLELS